MSTGYALDDISVVDLTTFVTGGFCTAMLANQGADVVKVERPGVGDVHRGSGPPFIDGESPYFWTVSYGKQSVELNLKTEAGQEAVHRLVEAADVVVQNFRPGAAADLGVDYETLSSVNPSLVYCSISAFGATGPWSHRPGYDLLIQGVSGIMQTTGDPDGDPAKVGIPITDLVTGMWGAYGVVNAIRNRDRTGTGEYIDLGMLDAILPLLSKQAAKAFADVPTERMGTRDPMRAPYQVYATADGYLILAGISEKLWRGLCRAIERPDLLEDDRFETNSARLTNVDDLEVELERTLRTRPTEEWVTVLDDAGVPAAPVNDVADALDNPQVDARDSVSWMTRDDVDIPVIEHPLRYANGESGFSRPPPRLGEHTEAVLRDAGFDDSDIASLRERGAFDG